MFNKLKVLLLYKCNSSFIMDNGIEITANKSNALQKAVEMFVRDEDYASAYELGEIILQQKNPPYKVLKNIAVSAIYARKQRKLLNHLMAMDIDRYEMNNLIAGIAGNLNNEELNREYAFRVASEKPLLVSRKNNPKIKVVVLQTIASGAYKFKAKSASFSIGEGHNNLTNLFDPLIAKNILRVDDLEKAKQALAAMHDVDFIYNSITDPERCFDALNNAEQICNSFPDIPVINHPQQVKLSSCEDNFSRFANAKHLIFPKVIKINQVDGDCKAKILKEIESNNLSYPIIVRLAGYQAGKNMHKINHADEHDFADFDKILNTVATDIYLIEFKDCSFQDSRLSQEKLYPKFRAFMANGQLFPIHLFVAKNDYNVHRDNSSKLMLEHPWLIELEQRYCEDPLSVIDKDVWESLSHILRKTGLEYVGVDFSVTLGASKQDQVCVIFEINAAMRNSMLSLSDRPHTQTSWRHVTQQMHDYMCVLANKSPWDFNCK